MAADYYLQLDGIKGESTDSMHLGWIECTSVNWSITQPKSATASTGGAHTAERAELSGISISKLMRKMAMSGQAARGGEMKAPYAILRMHFPTRTA